MHTYFRTIRLSQNPLRRSTGRLFAGHLSLPCAIGRGGIRVAKREGDGASPCGNFGLLRLWWRADRSARPRCGLGMRTIRRQDGWCDDPTSRLYNKPIALPQNMSHEIMWRDDHLYDFIIEIGWNRGPTRRYCGSAIFLHLARNDFGPTEGCVALCRADLRRLLPRIGPRTRILIG